MPRWCIFRPGRAVWLARNDDTGFQQVLERADYLAKEHTKVHCTGERNFGCSRALASQTVRVVIWRQLSSVSVPLCDNHSAVTATSLLSPYEIELKPPFTP